jgi:hypothetical protein
LRNFVGTIEASARRQRPVRLSGGGEPAVSELPSAEIGNAQFWLLSRRARPAGSVVSSRPESMQTSRQTSAADRRFLLASSSMLLQLAFEIA